MTGAVLAGILSTFVFSLVIFGIFTFVLHSRIMSLEREVRLLDSEAASFKHLLDERTKQFYARQQLLEQALGMTFVPAQTHKEPARFVKGETL
jgi:hypothetical protein